LVSKERHSVLKRTELQTCRDKGQRQEGVRKMSLLVETEDKILNKKRMVGEKRKFILQTIH
jgi:hypothetical protein